MSWRVFHIADGSMSATSWFVRELVPRSPWTALPIHLPNCVVTGLSTPRFASHRRTAVVPSLDAESLMHGFPKAWRDSANVRNDASSRTGIA